MSYYIWGEREGRGRRVEGGGGPPSIASRSRDGCVGRGEVRASQPHLHLGREGG